VPRPVAVAITGGLGAGKSEALAFFARHGSAVRSSDEVVHRLLREDDEIKRRLFERFGEHVFDRAGHHVDRRKLASVVFGDADALVWLERLLHPRVAADNHAWREGMERKPNPPALCVTEVPLLYETGGEERFDAVVVITAPPDLREQRGRRPDDERERRLLSDSEKASRADFSYVNDGSLEELDAFVLAVIANLTPL